MHPRLKDRASILELGSELNAINHGDIFVSMFTKQDGDVQPQDGIRSPAMVTVRAHNHKHLIDGAYLQCRDRLLHVTSIRDAIGVRDAMYVSCDEFIGRSATYYAQGRSAIDCRVHLTHDAPYLDDFGKVTSYRTKAEVLLIEVGRPQEGDQLRIGSVDYIVTQYANDSDDAVVRGLWLEAM